MQLTSAFTLLATLVSVVVAHEGHDHDMQMPLDYVKFPYQAAYPGDNEGNGTFTISLIFSDPDHVF